MATAVTTAMNYTTAALSSFGATRHQADTVMTTLPPG